jgi:hypothetical protein
MLAMSVKSVPGCLVTIVPSLIGVPVAATPGLGPHDDVLVDALVAALVLVAEVDEAAGAALLVLLAVLLLLELLPQPAMTSTPRTAANDRPSRTRGKSWNILTDLLLLEELCLTRPRGLASRAILVRGLIACNDA